MQNDLFSEQESGAGPWSWNPGEKRAESVKEAEKDGSGKQYTHLRKKKFT